MVQRALAPQKIGNDLVFSAIIPPAASQSMVRCAIEVKLLSGETLILPHAGEIKPVLSYFVYDHEIESSLPFLWIFNQRKSVIQPQARELTGCAIQVPDLKNPLCFDNAAVDAAADNGVKIHFLKGNEFRGDRTINIIAQKHTSNELAPSEYLSNLYYKEMNGITSRCEWFRTIKVNLPYDANHPERKSQYLQVVLQQINDEMVEMNGLNSTCELYKMDWKNYGSYEFHTDLAQENNSYALLEQELQQENANKHEILFKKLFIDSWLKYSVFSMLVSNWDGFHNNHWLYNDPKREGSWRIIPWDMDKTWGMGSLSFEEGLEEMPLDYMVTMTEMQESKLINNLHKDDEYLKMYKDRLQSALETSFTEEKLYPKIDDLYTLLSNEMDKMAAQTGLDYSKEKESLLRPIPKIKSFIPLRRQYLQSVLANPIPDWMVY